MKLTNQQARRFLLRYQGLLPPRQVSGKAAIMEYIRRVGCIQFDPLDQVGCNPHLVLQSRFRRYRPGELQELLYGDRLLIDGFDKNLAIWPVEDWPRFARNRRNARVWYGRDYDTGPLMETSEHVREGIRERGPLCSADFEAREKVSWPWGPTNAVRAALESLYFQGELVVHHKAGTRKYYDLAERHIAREILTAEDPNPDDDSYHRWRVLRRIGSIGFLWDKGGDGWLGISGLKGGQRSSAMAELTAAGDIAPLEVEGLAAPLYAPTQALPLLEPEEDSETEPQMSFLAPLDNAIWDRKIIEALFGFEYRWEVYTPQPQRKYGYYVLPVLYGDRFVARVEPRFQKKAKTLELLNWWWEDGVKPDAAMKKAFRACVKELAGYLGAKDVVYGETYQGPKV